MVKESNYKNLIKFLAISDTMHDFCNIDRISKITLIYKKDFEIFLHIILSLLKEDYISLLNNSKNYSNENQTMKYIENKIREFFNTIYDNNSELLWYNQIIDIENKMIEFINDLLVKKKIFKNLTDETNLVANNKLYEDNLNNNICRIYMLNKTEAAFNKNKNIVHTVLTNFNNKLNYRFVLDANSLNDSDKFFCLDNNKSLFKGIFKYS
jgi:hypothetical protein